jgi:DNA-binding HxlR family transcriptional regulator
LIWYRIFSTRTLAIRLKELQKSGILERQRYNEISPSVEYMLTGKGQELVESVINLPQWMRKWSKAKKSLIPTAYKLLIYIPRN